MLKRTYSPFHLVWLSALVACVALFLWAPPPPLQAQTGTSSVWGDSYDHEKLSVTTTAVPLTAAKVAPSGASSAQVVYITVETQPVRYWFDGTDPTATDGHQVKADGSFTVTGINNIRRLRMIQTAGGAATVMVSYFH